MNNGNYLTDGEKAFKEEVIQAREKLFEEFQRREDQNKWVRYTDVSDYVAQTLSGFKLRYYQAWCEARDAKNRKIASETLSPSPDEVWQQASFEYDEEDYTEEEIENFLRENGEDEISDSVYQEDWNMQDGEYELISRGKVRYASNQDKNDKDKYLKLKILCQKISRKIGILKKRISTLNKKRIEPLPDDYPDNKNLRILEIQLYKAQKQLLKSKLRLFSYQTQDLVRIILDAKLSIGNDLMSLELIGIAGGLKDLENVNGHPNLHHYLLQTKGKKERGYKRKNNEAMHRAMEDDISYEEDDEEYGDIDGEEDDDEWLAFSQGPINKDGTRRWLDIGEKKI